LELFSLFFLLITRNLLDLVSWIFGFNFLTLISLALFRFCFTKSIRKSQQESWDYQQEEKKQIRNFLASLKWDVSTSNYEKMATWLDNNSPRLFLSFFHSVIFRLPNLIIPGLAILFLFLYANFYKPGAHIDWNLYLVAFHCQNVFWKIGRLFDLFSSENSFRRNYFLIQKELDLLNAKS
jgi:hypothetical protein